MEMAKKREGSDEEEKDECEEDGFEEGAIDSLLESGSTEKRFERENRDPNMP
jgi:hypothetical protein